MFEKIIKKAVIGSMAVIGLVHTAKNFVVKHAKLGLAAIGLGVVAGTASAQTNSYGIPDGGGLTTTLSTPFNAAAGWWLAAVAFILVSGWVLMMLRRKR